MPQIIQPRYTLERASQETTLGYTHRPTDYNTFNFSKLLAFQQADQDGIFYERHTGRVMLEPVPRWRDMQFSQFDFGPADSLETPGIWRQITDPLTGRLALSQYSSIADSSWFMEPKIDILPDAGGFSTVLRMGACPKLAEHNRDNCYRFITWPAKANPGETVWRIAFRLGEEPKIEVGVVARDHTIAFRMADTLWCPQDLNLLRQSGNVVVTVTVMPVADGMLFWCGQELGKESSFVTGYAPTKAGTVRWEGKNGETSVGFAQLMYKMYGYVETPPSRAPRFFETEKPVFYFSPADGLANGQTREGRIETIDPPNQEWVARLTLTAPNADVDGLDDGYSVTTPSFDIVTATWPPAFRKPVKSNFVELLKVEQVAEIEDFDFSTGIVTRTGVAYFDNTYAQESIQRGMKTVRLKTGFAHTGLFNRGLFLAGTVQNFMSDDGYARTGVVFTDLWFIIERGVLHTNLYPAHWCVYSVARFLLEHAGIVPPILAKLPDCGFGPYPGCNHTLFGGHPGWEAGTSVMPCLVSCRQIEKAWMGMDVDGFFRFEPFDFRALKPPVKVFKEAATGYGGVPGGAIDEIKKPFRRTKSLEEIRNDISLGGFDQSDGRAFARHPEDARSYASKFDPNAPNYTGFAASFVDLWSGYSTIEFTDYVGKNMLNRFPLQHETCHFPAGGQPTLHPMDLILVNDRRSAGANIEYWITRLGQTWDSYGGFDAEIDGVWTGNGPIPGRPGT